MSRFRAHFLLGLLIVGPLVADSPHRFAWEILPAREVRPDGWLRQHWHDDFALGLPGRLDVVNADVSHRLFARQDTGLKSNGHPSWWPGDSETYWMEAYVHSAFQVGGQQEKAKATAYVEDIMSAQGSDGYIGIYNPAARLLSPADPQYGQSSGELNTQGHVFLTLIAYYEHTARSDVLDAVKRAALLTMRSYADGVFGRSGALTPRSGGNSHAVVFIDAMSQLYRITGDEVYLRFMAAMYEDYQLHPPRDHDLLPSILDDPDAKYYGHGAHTAESFHWLAAVSLLGDPIMKLRADSALQKLRRQLTPGGALISDEMINGRLGNGHDLYEYCTQAELEKSLAWITQYIGSPVTAELAERLYFNAILGARLHPLRALQYLSRDDRLDIPTNPNKEPANVPKGASHFQLSSIIRPACCPGSSGRPEPYFLASTWMKSLDGSAIALMNFAPCTLETTVAGVPVKIVEQTDYPFSDQIQLLFITDKPVEFELSIRLPLEGDLTIGGTAVASQSVNDGFVTLRSIWKSGDRLTLNLDLPVVLKQTQEGDAYFFRRGALTFALPFKADVRRVAENPAWRTGGPSGLFEYDVVVEDRKAWNYRVEPDVVFSWVKLDGDSAHPWSRPTRGLRGTMLDAEDQRVEVTLVPQASSVSRRVTFLDKTHSPQEAARLPESTKVSLGN